MTPKWSLISLVMLILICLAQGSPTPPAPAAPMLPSCDKPFTPYAWKGCFRQTGSNLHGYSLHGTHPGDYGWGMLYPWHGTYATPETCIAFCKGNLYRYAGLKQSSECFCGNMLEMDSGVDNAKCNYRCVADKTKGCGGHNSWTIYEDLSLRDMEYWKMDARYENLGCWSVETIYIQMTNGAHRVNPQECMDYCRTGGWPFAFLKGGDGCYCDVSVRGVGGKPPTQSKCNMPCRGDLKQMCGSLVQDGVSVYYSPDLASKELCASNGVEMISELHSQAYNYTGRIAMIKAMKNATTLATLHATSTVTAKPTSTRLNKEELRSLLAQYMTRHRLHPT